MQGMKRYKQLQSWLKTKMVKNITSTHQTESWTHYLLRCDATYLIYCLAYPMTMLISETV